MNPPAKPATAHSKTEHPPKPKPSAASGQNLAKLLPLCMGIACAHPQELHPVPLAEECPPGAVESMRELGIKIGDQSSMAGVEFPAESEESSRAIVKEGPITVPIANPFGGLPHKTELTGRLFFGERVYGRFTVARLPNDRTIPVCMEISYGWTKGSSRDPGPTPDTAVIGILQPLRAVSVFKE